MLDNIYKGQYVIITGVAGFIGSHLAERLLELGTKVIGIDNYSLGSKKNISHLLAKENFEFFKLDLITDCDEFLKCLDSKEILEVWHLAANSDISSGVTNPEIDLRNTFLTTHNILKICNKKNIKNFIFASSSAIYGDKGDLLISEDIGPLFPISNYGAMKLASESIISAAVESFLEKSWIFRFPNVVGSRATHGIIYDFLNKLKLNPSVLNVLGDGSQCKQYLHVSELINAMLFARSKALNNLNYFNLGVSDSSTKVKEIANLLLKCLNSDAKIIYGQEKKGWVGDVPKFSFSTKKINDLGWFPCLTSNQAVEKAIKEIICEIG